MVITSNRKLLHLQEMSSYPKVIDATRSLLNDSIAKYENTLKEINDVLAFIRSKFLIDALSLSKVEGKPFNKNEILSEIKKIIKIKN